MSFSKMFQSHRDALGRALDRSQAVVEFTPTGKILRANESFAKIMGYSTEELRGRHHSMFLDAATRESPAYRLFWRELAAGQYKSAEFKRFGKGGKDVWLQATYTPIVGRFGRTVKVIKLAKDVTESKMQNADFSGQVAAIWRSQAVVEFTVDGTILNANANFLKAVGYTLNEVRGRHHSMFVEPGYERTAAYKDFWMRLAKGEYPQPSPHFSNA